MKQPLKIAVVVGTFPVVSQTFIVNQINALIDDGHKVQIYAYKKENHDVVHDSLKKNNLLENVVYLQKPSVSKIKRFFDFLIWTISNLFKIRWRLFFKTLNVFKYGKDAFTLHLFYESQWFLNRPDFDIIHAHFGPYASRIAYLKSKDIFHNNTKLFTTFHGYDLKPNRIENYKKNYRLLLKHSNVISVNSEYLKGILLQVKPGLNNIVVLPVGLDTLYFKRKKTKKDNRYFDIVFCGRLITLKGPHLAIDIIKMLVNKGYSQVRLSIIGEGVMQQKLAEQIKALSLESHVFLKGALTQEEVKLEFEQSDVFLLPGIADPQTGQVEAQGLVIQEAQAMELPVVVSDVGGMKYGLIPNETGFVVKTNDIDAFTKALEKLILDSNLRTRMGKRGTTFVNEKFDNIVLVKQLLEHYNAVLDRIN